MTINCKFYAVLCDGRDSQWQPKHKQIDKNLGYRKISKKAHLSFGDIAKLKKEAEGISTEEKYT